MPNTEGTFVCCLGANHKMDLVVMKTTGRDGELMVPYGSGTGLDDTKRSRREMTTCRRVLGTMRSLLLMMGVLVLV